MTNVLIIDDNENVRHSLRGIFEDMSCSVTEATDGLVGMAKLNGGGFDLVLTDIFMPNQDGIETIREIRRNDSKVCIVAMSGTSGYDHIDFLGMACRIGANFAFPKPLGSEQIDGILGSLKTA